MIYYTNVIPRIDKTGFDLAMEIELATTKTNTRIFFVVIQMFVLMIILLSCGIASLAISIVLYLEAFCIATSLTGFPLRLVYDPPFVTFIIPSKNTCVEHVNIMERTSESAAVDHAGVNLTILIPVPSPTLLHLRCSLSEFVKGRL